MEKIKVLRKKLTLVVHEWSRKHMTGILVFNVFLAVMILLHSAGYFDPFLPLTTNIIFLFSLIMSVILLGLNSRIFFILALLFWLLAGVFKILSINIWAERTTIYVFEALVIGVLLLVVENVGKIKNFKRII